MIPLLDLLIGLSMGLNLVALGNGRLTTVIRVVSLQGLALGLMPLLMASHLGWHVALVSLATVLGKGFVIPSLLRRGMRSANIEREMRPFLGYVPSLLLGAGGTIAAVAFARALPLLPGPQSSLLVPCAMATVMTGFVMLIGRSKAISQVCGYLILENGIYVFGLPLFRVTPVLVEAGILLDLTVGVFLFGIILDRIQREFDSIDTRKLTALRE